MIKNLLHRYVSQAAREVQFRLGHRTTFKVNLEWVEADTESLSLSEWEDLKDLCLTASEKVFLETKGYVKGIYNDAPHAWVFSFVEWKDCLKVHFSFISEVAQANTIQFSQYWESLKGKSGLHVISGGRQSGKSTLLSQIVQDSKKTSPDQVVIHADPSVLNTLSHDSIFHLGPETLAWDLTHPFYDGIDTVVADFNDVTQWKKWVQFAEAGLRVILTLSACSVENVFLQMRSNLNDQPATWFRLISQLSSVINQRVLGVNEGAIQEILVLKSANKGEILKQEFEKSVQSTLEINHHYQGYNQSIVQALVRRRIDVKTAFAQSPFPDDLDQILKRMGL